MRSYHVTIVHRLRNAVALPAGTARKGIMKNITECQARLRGLFNITVTPFKADGAFDHEGLARNIERVIGLGFDGILIGGLGPGFPRSDDVRL